jgi:hypothetical protein
MPRSTAGDRTVPAGAARSTACGIVVDVAECVYWVVTYPVDLSTGDFGLSFVGVKYFRNARLGCCDAYLRICYDSFRAVVDRVVRPDC